MKVHVESISPVKSKLAVEVPPEEVSQEREAAYRDLQRTVSVPGFRKGKAPRHVLQRLYGDRVRSDVVGRVIEKAYYEALQAERIVPVSDAEIELQAATDEAGVAFTAVVEVRPKVEPTGYSGLRLQKETVAIDTPEVDARLEALRAQRATFEPSPDGHGVEQGDMVVIDYEGSVGGVPFAGGHGEDRTVIVGSGTLVPGFEEGILGMKAGEERPVTVQFPSDYRAEELAGKEAMFRISLKDVKVRRLPGLDDEFAKESAGADGLEDLRGKIREAIRAEKAGRAERELRERTIDALLGANPFEVPDSMVRSQQEFSLERLRQDLSHRGLDPEALGIARPEVQQFHRRAAERSVRWAFLLRALAAKEGIEVTDGDVEARLRAIAEADGRPYEAIRAFFEQDERLDALRSSMLEGKVLDRVLAAAVVEEVAPGTFKGQGGGDE